MLLKVAPGAIDAPDDKLGTWEAVGKQSNSCLNKCQVHPNE